MERQARQGRRRRIASLVLAALGALILLVGGVLFYAARTIFDSDEFADRATVAVEDERVRTPLAEEIVDALVDRSPDLVNARPLLVGAVEAALDSSAFRKVVREAARRAHRTLFTRDRDRLVLDLADATSVAIGAIRAISPQAARQIPPGIEPKLDELVSSDFAIRLVKLAEDVRSAAAVLPLLGLLALALAAAFHTDRRRGLTSAATAVALAAGAGLASVLVARTVVLAQLDDSLTGAGRAVWDAYLGDLDTALLLALGGSLLLVGAVAVAGRVTLAEPLAGLRATLARAPRTRGSRVARALIVLAIGIACLLSPDTFLRLLAVGAGALAILYALAELFRLVAPAGSNGAARGPAGRSSSGRATHTRRRWVVVAIGFAVAIAVAMVLLLGGDEERPLGPRPAAEIERCNGFAELCDRRLDEVSFPSVHNAMSSADRDFLMANNAKGVPEQLDAGVRGLLIDAHWGRRGEGGVVVTDLQAEGGEGKVRAQAVKATSERFVTAAERLIRRRALGDVEGGEPGVYWCHVFCELGSLPAATLLAEVSAFLDTHPDEVVVLFVEDYVPPVEIQRAAERSGLIDYVYTPPADGPLPTLREMIASGRRALVMAENEGGGAEIPWYVEGFDYAQETPYTFDSPAALEAPAACDENRGEPGNPLFQLNHWVEQVPRSPRTAAEVNAYDFLLGRARRCEDERDRLANLVAVDFWEQGDLFEVTRTLNGLPRGATPEYTDTG